MEIHLKARNLVILLTQLSLLGDKPNFNPSDPLLTIDLLFCVFV